VPLWTLLFNVASLSTSLGALAALAALAVHLRSRGLFLLLASVALLAADYVLGLVFFAGPDSPLVRGLADLEGAEGWVTRVFCAKGICHVGVLLTGPLAVLLLFGRKPTRAASWAVLCLSAVLLAAIALLAAGVVPRRPAAIYSLTALPASTAYIIILVLLVRLRPTLDGPGPGPAKGIVTAATVFLLVMIPALLTADILGLTGAALRMLPVDPVAFLVLTVGILVCSLLVLLGSRRQASAGDVDGFCARHGLSVREREVLLLLGRGLQYKQAAAELGISLETVKTHVARIYRKTGSTGKTDLFYRIRLGSD
jgi:DNA-binding CsgD family transcriptional regulator